MIKPKPSMMRNHKAATALLIGLLNLLSIIGPALGQGGTGRETSLAC